MFALRHWRSCLQSHYSDSQTPAPVCTQPHPAQVSLYLRVMSYLYTAIRENRQDIPPSSVEKHC